MDKRISFITNQKKPACASERDVLELATLWYVGLSYLLTSLLLTIVNILIDCEFIKKSGMSPGRLGGK